MPPEWQKFSRLQAGAAYDGMEVVKRRLTGPGLAKAGVQRLFQRRQLELWQSSDYRWRELFESADVVSEGAVREELDGPVYYGTTSVLLPYRSRGGFVPDEQALQVSQLVSRDLHARVRAIRIACREAQVRSKDPIQRVSAEFIVRPDARGVRVDIDVEARVAMRNAEQDSDKRTQDRTREGDAPSRRRRTMRG